MRTLWIHTPHDGRGRREIFLDGEKLERVVRANTLTGEVEVLEYPVRIRGDEVVTSIRKGLIVTVVFP